MRRIRWRFSGSGPLDEDEGEGSTRARICEEERGALRPFCQMASGTLRRTIALRDMGTLIMLASSRMASLALFRLSVVSSSFSMAGLCRFDLQLVF